MNTEPQDDIIRLLPDSVANQIAAGEVIQRPASVIKELVENSVDAGATTVEIVIKDAGKTLIQVVDDGKGMSTTDARMAFERHATSKIRCADDLFTLHTMGFRGEALPSIAAVSELEVTSRRDCDELGTKLVIRASHVDSQEPATAMKGTNIKVKNLFYNFVARRRFLKKDSVELSHIIHEFERLALVNTGVSFKLSSNGVMLHSLPRGPLKDRITALFGKTVGGNLIPVNTETSLVRIDGFISLPSAARQRGQRQFLFVNGRNMRHPYFHRAILSCYDNLIAKDVQPHYFINFNVAPDRIDVNIHPQKHEIKFEDEQSIWQILTAAVREALGRYGAGAAIDFNTAGVPDIPPLVEGQTPPDLRDLTESDSDTYNPFELKADGPSPQGRLDVGTPSDWLNLGFEKKPSAGVPQSRQMSRPAGFSHDKSDTRGWQEFYASLEQSRRPSMPGGMPDNEPSLLSDEITSAHGGGPLMQLRNKYIVTETTDGILLIDQHRAHVNLLYHSLLAESRAGDVASQALIFNESLELEPDEQVMLDSSIDLIERIGFRIGRDAEGKATLDGVPGTLGAKNPVAVLRNILADLSESGIDVEADALQRVILTMARSAAMTAGRQLTLPEMEHIVSSLFRLPSPGYTPDGLTVIYRLTDDRLASFFN